MLTFGNVFDDVFSPHSFLNLYYKFRAKGSDYIGQRRSDSFDPTILKQNTFQIEHQLGVNYDYQFDGGKRLTVRFLASLGGKNIPETFEGDATFGVEF